MAGCVARRADGTPCRGVPLPSGPYCWAHEPSLAEQRREIRARGGRNSATHRRLMRLAPPELRELTERLLVAADEVHRGRLDPRRAMALAALARAAAAVVQQCEVLARIEVLEQRLEEGGIWTSFGD